MPRHQCVPQFMRQHRGEQRQHINRSGGARLPLAHPDEYQKDQQQHEGEVQADWHAKDPDASDASRERFGLLFGWHLPYYASE
jgi:hypothetical protein